jgi:hypothetical protein
MRSNFLTSVLGVSLSFRSTQNMDKNMEMPRLLFYDRLPIAETALFDFKG